VRRAWKRIYIYTDKWPSVCVFIAMRESCENSELGTAELFTLDEEKSNSRLDGSEGMESMRKFKRRSAFGIKAAVSIRISRDFFR